MGEQEVAVAEPAPAKDEQTMAFLAHLLMVFTGFIAPLVIYVVKRDSKFVAFHSMQALLWQIVYFVLTMGAMVVFIVAMVAIGVAHSGPQAGSSQGPPPAFIFFFPLIWLMFMGGWVLNLIIGITYGVKANRGEWAAYPIIGRWARRIVHV